MDVTSLAYFFVVIFLFDIKDIVDGAKSDVDVSFNAVIQSAKHRWRFNKAKSLYGIADEVTGKRGIIRQGGAKLMSIGRLSGNSFLILEGNGSSIELGRFDSCIGDISNCKRGFTISLWLRFRDIERNSQYIIGNILVSSNEKGFSLLRTKNNEMIISYANDTHRFYAKYPATSNMWIHHLITWNGKRIIVYQNGKKLLEGVHTRAKTDLMRKGRNVANGMLSLGRRYFKIDADYDDVTFWERILNETEAASVYIGNIVDPVITKCVPNTSSICLTWSISDDPYGQIQFVKLLHVSHHDRRKMLNIQKESSSICIDMLGAMTSYTFSLIMKIKNSEKYFQSKKITCETTDGVPVPPNLHVTGRHMTSLEIIWQTPSPSHGFITGYLLAVKETIKQIIKLKKEFNAREIRSTDIVKYVVNVTNLQPVTNYTIEVNSISKAGKGNATIVTAMTTPFVFVPAKFEANVIDSDKLKITWTMSPQQIISYRIFIKPRYGEETYIDADKSPTIIDNLMPFSRYTIDFQPRYRWGTGERLAVNIAVKTKDKNECNDPNSNNCDINADCFNVESSFLCQCKLGFVGDGTTCQHIPPGAKEKDFCNAEKFRDILWPKMFKGGVAVKKCPNGTIGFASRKCLKGHHNDNYVAVYELPNLSDCVSKNVAKLGEIVDDPKTNASLIVDRMLKVTQTPKGLYGGDVKKTIQYFDVTIQEKLHDGLEIKKTSPIFIDVASNLLNDSMVAAWNDLPMDKKSVGATKFVESLENLAEKISHQMKDDNAEKRLLASNIDLQVQRIDDSMKYLSFSGQTFGKRSLPMAESKIMLPIEEITAHGGVNASVVFYTLANLNKVLSDLPLSKSKRRTWNILNSNLVSATILGYGKIKFRKPVVIVMPHLQEKYTLNTSCVFWNISKSSQNDWLDTGCYVNETTSNYTICHCYHLTNFAVLMTVSDAPIQAEAQKHQFSLRIISFIGLTISLCAMTLALLTFCCFSFLQGARTTYHKHLVASLIIANLLFIVGIDRTENAVVCTVIAILLHYFFIVAFVWMAMEGVLLYFMLKKIFSNRNFLKKKRFMALCWAVPALYITILSSLQSKYYGNKEFCWLSRKNGFIWSFVGPVILALLINFGVMFHAFQVMCGKRKKTDSTGHLAEIWYWLKGCLVLTCLLGVTWILGVFYVDSNTIFFAYLFTIFNALQGLFIFIFHCVIDSRVRREYIRLLKCQKRYEYNEKAGYSSSLKFRKWSGSVKSIGSLDRSLSHSSAKRTKSDSLDRSLLKHFHNNDSISEAGRYTLLRSISSTKSEKGEKCNGSVSEKEPLFQTTLEVKKRLEPNGNGHIACGLQDDKDSSSYSSVFESENEDKPKEQEVNVTSESTTEIQQTDFVEVEQSEMRNRDSVDSRDFFDDDNDADDDEDNHCNDANDNDEHHDDGGDNDHYNDDNIDEHNHDYELSNETSSICNDSTISLTSYDAQFSLNHSLEDSLPQSKSLHSIKSEIINEQIRNSSYSLHFDCLCSTDDLSEKQIEPEPVVFEEFIEDKKEFERFVEEEQRCCFLEDKRLSMHFGKLENILESNSPKIEQNSPSDSHQSLSSRITQRKIEFEVEELPRIEDSDDDLSLGRRSVSPDKKRTETSLRIGIPKLISVSSIDSEPISPIIISIDPDDQEFKGMLEAEIEMTDDEQETRTILY